ncbi:E3 ubiquitin-protein ligase RNF139-like [Neocloeon triangulifer]|uniref:E3 ubiquitin-protein ligase RNF139-like n=1 Tax=Neocloeon triangulifer TaxID=2078957 RepID=UPI00286F34B2|nr:E3 ubiquitin-protein ligase RNF139-like [Neocloeon triangulifer]
MGMISRVRARLRSLSAVNSCNGKDDARLRDERNAQSVCLLSVILLLPYLVRSHASSLLVSTATNLVYSCLVLPIVVSAHYKYPLSGLGSVFGTIKECIMAVASPFVYIVRGMYRPVDRAEQAYIKMTNIAALMSQVLFFMLCDRVLVEKQRVTALYSVMFYNVIAYCVSYLHELIEKEDWSPWINITKTSNIHHLAMSTTKVVLEWTKAVTFIITVVFMLLLFGLEQGLQHYQPTVVYTIITWLYYMATEKVFTDLFPGLLLRLQIERLDSLELLYAPVILKAFAASMSFIMAIPLLIWGHYKLFFVAMYFNVYLRCREMSENCLRPLLKERNVLKKFRSATKEEIGEWDDVCAICLSPIKKARITPCHHIFHGDCLRMCLKYSDNCAICKKEIRFD